MRGIAGRGAYIHRRPVRAAVFALIVIAVSACVRVEGEPQGPVQAPVLADGEVFAMVTVGVDESGATTLGVDLAEMLTGEEAREKAVEDGVIQEGEDLPNDFYIANDEQVFELVHLGPDPVITVISGDDTSQMLEIDEVLLIDLWEGTYDGEAVYGIIPGTPIPMDVTLANGVVTKAAAVYLP